MRIFGKLIFALVIVWVSWPSIAHADEILRFATREEMLTNRFSERVLSEAYARLNIRLEFLRYPAARSIIEADEGRADGEVARLSTVLKQYTNLRHIPVPLFYTELSAFVHSSDNSIINDWQSLNGRKLTTVLGYKFIEDKLSDQSVKAVVNTEQALSLVNDDKVEVAVLNNFLGRLAAAKMNAENLKLITPPLERLPVYHLLHKKHETLLPKVTSVLESMEQKGEIQSMWEEFKDEELRKASVHDFADEPDVYYLNTTTGAPYATSQKSGFLDLVVAEVFRRIGRKGQVELSDASARALKNANNNVDQGVAMRIEGLDKQFPNLVRVDELLVDNDFVASSIGLELKTDGWASLKPYVVAHINGWLIFEKSLDPDQKKEVVAKPSHMFSMLQKGRVDFALYERWQSLQWAKDNGVTIRVQEPPLVSREMFIYMHKQHAHLAPELAVALRNMKADGTYQEIYDKAFKPLLGAN